MVSPIRPENALKGIMIIPVYIPRHGSSIASVIKAKSGVVGQPGKIDGVVDIYYEGGIYGQFDKWGPKIFHAWNRMSMKAPTIARATVMATELIPVGELDTSSRRITVTDEKAVKKWLGSIEEADLIAVA